MRNRHRDVDKARQWQQTIHEAARSGLSTREFCRRRRIKEHQFYWWQHRLNENHRRRRAPQRIDNGKKASFALVSNDPGAADAGIELVLVDGRRLRFSRGVNEKTLRAVLAAVGPEGC